VREMETTTSMRAGLGIKDDGLARAEEKKRQKALGLGPAGKDIRPG